MDKESEERMRKVGAAIMIPFAMAVPPIAGWFIGRWLDRHFHTTPFLAYTFLILGIIGGSRECYKIIKGLIKYK